MNWEEFSSAVPELAELAETRLRKDELCLLGTLRMDGSPRISPCEIDFAAGRLFLGMMWRSKKALDLLRDPRIVVHSVPSDKTNPGGDVKLYGRAIEELERDVRRAFQDAIRARIDWEPREPNYHVFSLDVESASSVRFADDPTILVWDGVRGLHSMPFPDVE
ncbi:MAG TPA: pyridoxamine 5'-phosphate oxidase family protein [Actinomycetota bacterium]|nr:pyridoxamine 5'-phosphate oxidase family protein [Actinomycetota bacterium]